jgi:hypothetical protein
MIRVKRQQWTAHAAVAVRRRVLAGDGRAGVWARGEARRAQRAFLARTWRRLLAFVVVVCAVGGPALLLLPVGLRGFAAGSLVTATIAAAVLWVVQATGTAATMMGDTAEQWTAAALRRLRRGGWHLVNHVTLTHGDIDHVLVGPGGAYAVETKWRSRRWTYDEQLAAAAKLADNAKRLRLWQPFKAAGVDTVTPVIVIWGPADQQKNAVTMLEPTGTVLLAGAHLTAWLEKLPRQGLTPDQVEACWHGLDDQVRRRDTDEDPCPPSMTAMTWRAGGVLGAGIAAFLVLGAALPLLGITVWALLIAAAAGAGITARRHPALRRYATGWIAGCTATAGIATVTALAYYAAH